MDTIEGIRVDDEITLRWPTPADAEALFTLVEDNRDHLARWLPWVGDIQTVEDERRWIEGSQQAMVKGRENSPLIIYQGALVGAISIHSQDFVNRHCEIGYWVSKSHEGRGIVTRACRALLACAFESLGMHHVDIRMAPQNTRSAAIPQRLGLVYEGVLRESQHLNGQHVDHAVYSMLISEWADLKAKPTGLS